jgi:DnaJ like chaperone protein
MTLWERITAAIAALKAGQSLADVFDTLRRPPEHTIAFTIAVIALSAKMAKADGIVTRDEVRAFRSIFHIAPEAEAQAARVFNLARQDVAGFDAYARKLRAMFDANRKILSDLFEGLVFIAMADGEFHPSEDAFLQAVATEFELPAAEHRQIYARQGVEGHSDPYIVLGVSPDQSLAQIKAVWRQMVREMHPDTMMARGVPQEAIKLAEARLSAVNDAWREIQDAHGAR